MDTANKLSKYAKENGKSINFVGVAKTIDNDLPEMDRTPCGRRNCTFIQKRHPGIFSP